MGDISFICGGLSAVEASASGAPAFSYHFTRTNLVTWPLGAAHGLDLPYVFGTFDEMHLPAGEADRVLSRAMQTAWTTFARDGAPEYAPTWPAYTKAVPRIALLDDEPDIVDGVRNGRCAALRELGLVP